MNLDVRCSAVWPDATTELDDDRCQAMMGHEHPHALVVAAAGGRQLWLWRGSATSKRHLREGVPFQLSWAPRMPRSAAAVTRLVPPRSVPITATGTADADAAAVSTPR